MRKLYLYFSFIILISTQVNAQTSLRGMYIDNFHLILGNTSKEDSLLQYAQDSSFNYLALYSLHQLNLSNTNTANTLGSFIYKARVMYGITYVGAVCETYNSFQNTITPFNLARTDDNEKFNVFNLEFEFWTSSSVGPGGYYCTQYLQSANCNCDTSGGFKYYISELHKIDSLAATQNVISETYLGWFNQGQAQQIHNNVDRILLHAYRTGTSSLYSYSAMRLQYLASSNTMVNVAPIFSAEPGFMGPWLDSHSQSEAYNQYKTDFDNDNSSWKQYINILGHQWFDWGFMPKPVPGSGGSGPTITTSGPLSFCSGGSVNLTASTGTAYLWSSGATTRSITVTASGNYYCQVTSGGNTQSTSVISVDVKNNPTVSISQMNPNANPVTINSTSSPESGTITAYQWRLNGNNINGAQASSYDAIQSGNYFLSVSNSYGCYAISNAENVTVSSSSGIFEIPIANNGKNGDENEAIKFNVYPNPSNEILTIDLLSSKTSQTEIKLADINNRIIYEDHSQIAPGLNKAKLNLTKIGSGIYFLLVRDDSSVFSKRIIIAH